MMVLVGITYVAIGVWFPNPPDPETMRYWRLGAWGISAAVGAGHIWYERYRVRSAPRVTALHTAGAVAIGAFGLAVAATVHKIATGAAGLHSLLIALPVWPIMTAIPVFLVVLAIATVLDRLSPRR
jgi:hypothetical protein